MCRLLLLRNSAGVDPNTHLEAFKSLSKNSQEYQGHGWGCAWLDDNNKWQLYHHINPIWEDTKQNFPQTRLFLAHARSAFRDEGIAVENNMPFTDGDNVFLFNGELQGVRIKSLGRIGAEKIFNYVKRFDKGDLENAIIRATEIINKRTRYIRAMNFFIANSRTVHVYSQFGEDPEYFQLRSTHDNQTHIICSQSYALPNQVWDRIENHQLFSVT